MTSSSVRLCVLFLGCVLVGCGAGGTTTEPLPDGGPRFDAGVDGGPDAGPCAGADLQTDVNNCGVCGHACAFDHAGASCQSGECVMSSCADGFHDLDGDAGDGCEYACVPTSPSTEVCDGLDNDCNGAIDDNPTDPDLGSACGDTCDGGTCVGECHLGTLTCQGGAKVCAGAQGPTAEVCDGLDNDCNGSVDEPFTATWNDAERQSPRYDSDPQHCGSCTAPACALPNGANICRLAGGDTRGSCAIAACNQGFSWVPKIDSNPARPTCDVTTIPPRDSTQSQTGIGCFYACTPTASETCDGVDNDCNGCIDDGLTPPSGLCATQGVCAGQTIPEQCKGAEGWKCDYSGVPNVSIDGNGALTATDGKCDGLDNNCNGACDEDFPDVAVTGPSCNNPRAAKACTSGFGVCQMTAATVCQISGAGEFCPANADFTKASDEKCNGIDDDCNGLVDEHTDFDLNGTLFHGLHDPTVAVSVGVDSATGQPAHTVWIAQYEASRTDGTASAEGTRTDRACSEPGRRPWTGATWSEASAACVAAGGRLCSELEWQTSCEGPTPPPSGTSAWSQSSAPQTYAAGVCNDANSGRGAPWATGSGSGSPACFTDFGATGELHDLSGNVAEWTLTPHDVGLGGTGASLSSSGTSGIAVLTTSGLTGVTAGDLLLLSGGNGSDDGWFRTVQVSSDTLAQLAVPGFPASGGSDSGLSWSDPDYVLRGGSVSSPSTQTTCEYSGALHSTAYSAGDVGFRCCFGSAP